MSEAEDIEHGPGRVVSIATYSVITEPGAVKVLHRSGRVVLTLTGATMKTDGLLLAADLLRVLGDDKRLAREVELRKPWWAVWR